MQLKQNQEILIIINLVQHCSLQKVTIKHKGKSTQYLDYFLNVKPDKIIFDQLQSEQGARFYNKRNRNIIILIDETEEIDIKDNFRFLTINQISNLILQNNLVNMDTRSVLSHLNCAIKPISQKKLMKKLRNVLDNSIIDKKRINNLVDLLISSHQTLFLYIHSILFTFNNKAKFKQNINQLIPLNFIKNWKNNYHEIYHVSKKYFSIIGVSVSSVNREVASGINQS